MTSTTIPSESRYIEIPNSEVDRIANLIAPLGAGPLRVADPCCGEGLALAQIKTALEAQHGLQTVTFGTEADQERAAAAANHVDQCLWSPYQGARWESETMDVLLLNSTPRDAKLALHDLREIQDVLCRGGLLFYIIRQRYLKGPIATRLAGHFDVLAVYPYLPEHSEPGDQVVVVARRRAKNLDDQMKQWLVDVGKNGQYDTGEQQELLDDRPPLPEAIWGYPNASFIVPARQRRPFHLRRKDVLPNELAADAERFGVRTSHWWKDQVETIPQLRSSSLLPLRDTQIANLLFLGFADNGEFEIEGHHYLFRGQTRVVQTDVTSDEDRDADVDRRLDQVQKKGVMLSLETGKLRDVDTDGMLSLVRLHAEAFAKAVTDQVPPLRAQMMLEDWEERVLSQVYRFQRLPGRAEYGLTHVQKVTAAVTAQAIEERHTPVVVLNSDTGSGKTGIAFGAALCLRKGYLDRGDHEWFADPQRGGHKRRRMHMKSSAGTSRAWMQSYGHSKPFCIAFAAEPHTLDKMAREAKACLPLSHVYVARDTSDVEEFVRLTKRMGEKSIAVLIVPKSMSKLGSGWVHSAVQGLGTSPTNMAKRPYTCPDCGAVAVYHVRDDKGNINTYPVYKENLADTLARVPTRCERCTAPLFQSCRIDFRTGDPALPKRNGFFRFDHQPQAEEQPSGIRYPVAEYIYRRYRDFFEVTIWDEAHDANGVGTDIVAAYQYLTRAARLGWIEATASNMNGKASDVFTRAFHSSAEVRRRFKYDERGEFADTYGIFQRVTFKRREIDVAGRYTGRQRMVNSANEAPGVQPQLTLLMVPYTISTMIEDLGAPLPPRLEVSDEFAPAARHAGDPFGEVVHAYRQLSDFDVDRRRSAEPSKYQACLAYLNAPWNTERITASVYDKTGKLERDAYGKPLKEVLLTVDPTWDLHDTRLLPKEERLLQELDRALTEGHGISVMIGHVERGIQERLTWLIDRRFGPGSARYCNAPAERRERWYAQAVRDGVKAIISHPQKLRTGLDLLAYPWIYFYQPVSSSITIIQSKGRAWRLGQEWACETHFWYYEGTEEHALFQIKADDIIADNLLKGGDLAGGLMELGRQIESVELARAALEQGNLRHLGVLLQQGAVGDWLSREQIAAQDQERDRARRTQRETERAQALKAMQNSFQMALL